MMGLLMNPTQEQFLSACREGDLALVKLLLKEKEIDINYSYENGTPLVIACRARQFNIVQVLLNDERIEINKKVSLGYRVITAFQEACYNGGVNIVKLFLIDERTDKSDILNLISELERLGGSDDLQEKYRVESLKILILLYADQEHKGMELCKTYFNFNQAWIDMLIFDDNLALKNPRSESKCEAESVIFAFLLFAAKKDVVSLDSVTSALLDLAPPDRDKLKDKKFKDKFNELIYPTISNNLPKFLNEIREQANQLYKLKYLPQRQHALTFLHGFFSEMKKWNTKTRAFTEFAEGFENLPSEVKIRVVGNLFKVPESLLFSINEDTIEEEVEKNDQYARLI